jgi:hypothetical protein
MFEKRTGRVEAILCLALLLAGSSASAASTAFTLTPFTFSGDPVELTITLDDEIVAGSVELTATVSSGIGDIRGLFFDLVDDSVLAGLSVTGSDVDEGNVLTGSVINLGGGNNLNGGGTPCPCDVGVEIGTPGIGKDDIQTTVLLISHSSVSLDLSDFADQAFGGRVASTGAKRKGSSKLVGVVPEPGTALLLAFGVVGLALRPRASR